MSRTEVDHLRPMPLAELDACCGQLHWTGSALEQCGTSFTDACENCPLLIERKREAALRMARAL